MFYLIFIVLFVPRILSHPEDEFDLNDILSNDFMPTSFLMIDRDVQETGNETVGDNNFLNQSLSFLMNGSFTDAFKTMKFHRKMMNEYLCRNFLADQILEEMIPTTYNRRVGRPAPFSAAAKAISKETGKSGRSRKPRLSAASAVKDNLLEDEGSSNYKDWLSKTTTLEDIYQHYKPRNKVDNEIDDFENDDSPHEDFDSDITGFAVQGIVHPPQPAKNHVNVAKVGNTGHSGYGYPSTGGYPQSMPVPYGGSAHGQEYVHQHYEPAHVPQFVHYHHGGGSSKKEMILKDLFEIALTALAFLSFGIFAIQVILCIAATHQTTTTSATFLSMVDGGTATGGTATGTGGGTDPTSEATGPAIIIANDAINPPNSGAIYSGSSTYDQYTHYREGAGSKKRQRRFAATPIDNSLVNELARRVLVSMEAVFYAHMDDGNCLRREICSNNKYSRSMDNNQKLWIPVYGLALSWLSGRVSTRMASTAAMLESLKAAALGLGNSDCNTIYYGCDLHKARESRRRRRRKRSQNGTSFD